MCLSLFPASRAAHIKALEVLGLYDLRILECFLKEKPQLQMNSALKVLSEGV